MTRVPAAMLIALLGLAVAAPSSAQPLVDTADRTAADRPDARPTPLSDGVGSDFGGPLGEAAAGPVRLALDTDLLGRMTIELQNQSVCMGTGSASEDVAVIYLATGRGGVESTAVLDDTSDDFRAAVSGGAAGGAADVATLVFGGDFRPSYAVAFQRACSGATNATLFALAPGVLSFVPLTATYDATSQRLTIADMTLADLGLAPGETLSYFATLLNVRNGYRSNELHGVATPPAVIGFASYTVGSFNRFTSVPPVVINEIDADQVGTDTMEFIELAGPPGVDLTGTSIVLYNGEATNDVSYRGVSLGGHALNDDGFFVLGNVAVTPAPGIVLPSNAIQNGPHDAVALYVEETPRPNGSTPDTNNLADAVVYSVGSMADDPELRAALGLASQPLVVETTTTSSNRCPPALQPLVTDGWRASAQTPWASNDCAVCGNGVVEPGEDCDPAGGPAIGCCTAACRFAELGTVCRAADGLCDAAETCPGDSAECPADQLAAAGTVCRAADGACDLEDRCDGVTPDCPDELADAGTVCRAATGSCDLPESCDGVSTACPADALAAAGTVCRPASGDCDLAEACTGDSAACPPDGFVAAGVECRAAAGVCDLAEACTGDAAGCPADAFVDAGTECRAAAGACDLAEACTGMAAACPADAFVAMGTVCRAAAGPCDLDEVCSGSGAACPPDLIATADVVCRAADGPCDVAERCDGAAVSCPPDELAAAGTVCRPAADACDVAEACTGTVASCPPDALADDGTVCEAGDACVTASLCATGACVAGTITDCDDGDPCTADACSPTEGCSHTPIDGCVADDAGVADAGLDGGLPDGALDLDAGVPDAAVDDAGPEDDAGLEDDAGVSADAGLGDAAVDDAGPEDDAGPDDAASVDRDASPDAGPEVTEESGCGCRAVDARDLPGAALILGLIALARRRRW